MSYNLTILDSRGTVETAHVGPGRAAEFRPQPLATNHRWQQPRDPAHAARYRSVERYDRLTNLLADKATADDLSASLLRPPLYARDYRNGFGTLYTAEYRPSAPSLTYHWPGTSWVRTFDSPEDTVNVVLSDA
jgi:predicted choloylglycine hydrolase